MKKRAGALKLLSLTHQYSFMVFYKQLNSHKTDIVMKQQQVMQKLNTSYEMLELRASTRFLALQFK